LTQANLLDFGVNGLNAGAEVLIEIAGSKPRHFAEKFENRLQGPTNFF
jgi:hypothetical protein